MKTLLPIFLFAALAGAQPQTLTPEQQKQVDDAIPAKAPAKPKKPRKLPVISLAKVGDRVVRGHPAIPAGIYAFEQMGKRTGAFDVTVTNELDQFKPDKISQ